VTVENGTGNDRGVGLGFVKNLDTDYETLVPTYYWENVMTSKSISTTLQPTLRAYVTSEYSEGMILQDPVSAAVVFEADLFSLPSETSWTLSHDSVGGQYSITRRE